MGKKNLSQERLQELKDYISIGKKFSEKEFKNPNKKYREYYKVEHYKTKSGEDRVSVPEIFSVTRTILPNVLNNRPHIMCKPNTKEAVKPAKINQALANSMWKDLSVQPEVVLSVINFLVSGWGIAKLGWQYESKTIISNEPRNVLGVPLGSKKKKEEITIKDDAFVEWVDPDAIYVSPDAKTLDDSPFVIQEVIIPLDKVKNNPEYKNTKDLKATKKMSKEYIPSDIEDDENKAYLNKVVLYEVYLRDTFQIITMADGHDKELSVKNFPYKGFKTFHPFEEIRNYEVPGEFYPFGEAKPIFSQQEELDKLRSRMFIYGKRFNRTVLYNKSAGIDENSLKQLKAGKDGSLVEMGDIEGLKVLEYPDIGLDTSTQEIACKEDIQRITGISEYQRATSPAGQRTATESNAIQQGSEARPNEKLGKVELFMARIAQKLIILAQQYYDDTRTLRIIDDEGIPEYIKYNRETLAGDFNIDIEIGSTQAKNPEMERKQAMELFERVADDKNVNRRELIKDLFKTYKKDKNENLMLAQKDVPEDPPPELKPVATLDNRHLTPEQQVELFRQLGYELPPPNSETMDQQGKIIGEQAKAQSSNQQSEQQLAIEAEKAQLEMQKAEQDMAIERQKAEIEVEKAKIELDAAEDKVEAELILTEKKANLDMAIQREKAQLDKKIQLEKAQQEQALKVAKAAREASQVNNDSNKSKVTKEDK